MGLHKAQSVHHPSLAFAPTQARGPNGRYARMDGSVAGAIAWCKSRSSWRGADMLQPLTSTSRTSASRCSCPQALCAASALASLRVGGQSVAAPPRIPRIGLSGSSGYGQTVLGTPLPIMVARGHSSATQFRPSTTVSDVRFPACHRAPLHTGGPSCYPRQTRQAAPSREAPTSLQYWCRVPLFRVPRPLPTRRVPLPRPSRGPRPRRPPWRLRRVDEQGSKI
mmetsp:Transcript_19497/g.58954  ORF Transcript_19497/g.58954 Transcript_19497/m.58954 type:complete len:223 (+) Transcript_19497:1479-2147(+)